MTSRSQVRRLNHYTTEPPVPLVIIYADASMHLGIHLGLGRCVYFCAAVIASVRSPGKVGEFDEDSVTGDWLRCYKK